MNRLVTIPLTALAAMTFSARGDPTVTHATTPAEGPVEKCSYIGIATSIPPPALREQLNLPRGVGVIIDDVEPESPADHAGLVAHDVIEKLNDQWIINVQQLSVLVRMQKPGETVHLQVIHAGKQSDLSVVLSEKALPAVDEAPAWLRPGMMPIPRPGTGRITGIVTHTDEETTITITSREEDRQVLIRDHAGNVLFEGPLNSPEQWAKLPTPLREKVERIERSSTAHLNALRNISGFHEPTTEPN